MSRSHAGDPVAQRFVGGILERAGAGVHRHHCGAQELHAVDVERLARDVLRAHVHDALEPEPGRHGRGRDAVLPCPGLGDNPMLAHPAREQHLADGVVDLVGSRCD